jgi:hypothetical protein
MACIATNSADDAGGVVLSLRTIIFAMSNLTTVLTGLVLVVSESSVERCKFSKLVTLELVLAFGNRSRSFNDVDQLLRLVDLFFGICHDQTVKIFLLVTGVSCVRTTLALLHGALATNGNLGPRVILHLL